MLKPRFLKYAKSQKGRLNMGIKSDKLCYGDWGLKADQPSIIKAIQISAAILAIKRSLKKDGFPRSRIFPHIPVTEKPSEVRMGKGKGSVSHFITRVQTGTILIEICGADSSKALSALKIAQFKLPLLTSIVSPSSSLFTL